MTPYKASTKDMLFVIKEIANLSEISKLPSFDEASPDAAEAIVDEAG